MEEEIRQGLWEEEIKAHSFYEIEIKLVSKTGLVQRRIKTGFIGQDRKDFSNVEVRHGL